MQISYFISIQDDLGICNISAISVCVSLTPQASMFLQQRWCPRQGVGGSSWHSAVCPGGKQRGARRQIVASIAVNLDVQKQLIFLPTPVDTNTARSLRSLTTRDDTQSRIKDLNQHAAKGTGCAEIRNLVPGLWLLR